MPKLATVAYLANQFPSPVEPYVMEEIQELRKRGVSVIACSARQPVAGLDPYQQKFMAETLYLLPLKLALLARGLWFGICKFHLLAGLLGRALFRGREPLRRRIRALGHTWLGVCYALQLRGRGIRHIHVHHGYFASWVALVAARLVGIPFSLTLHGSDLLLHPAYLDTKLAECKFCLTISEFNRRHLLQRHPHVDPEKILLRRMGTSAVEDVLTPGKLVSAPHPIIMLSVGRLHPVKDHAFLVRACRKLKNQGTLFRCWIAGEGSERRELERLIRGLNLQDEVCLLGHLCRAQLDSFYAACDLVVLTSRSEGLPLVLMEGMAHGKLVLAPAITGIPELVIHGKTGFVYRPGCIDDFAGQVQTISERRAAFAPIRQCGRQFVLDHFDRGQNLARFSELFILRVFIHPMTKQPRDQSHANSLLQQI